MQKINSYLVLVFLFTGAAVSSQSPKEENNLRNSLNGKWEWSYTRGSEKGNIYHVTSESMKMTVQYLFDRDSVSIFINDHLNEKYMYLISGDTLLYGQEKVLFELSSKTDSLLLMNSSCCEDIFEKLFVKGEQRP